MAQTTYYVASNGNDSNDGRSKVSPFQSLNKVNSLWLQAGDSVLFRRGDTFTGTLVVRQSGSANRAIVFDAYGNGLKPIISGAIPVGNWSNVGGNVWQANCSSCGNAVTGLYRNGVALPLSRYPNTDAPNRGNLHIRAHTDNYQIFSQEQFPPGIDWKGAEVVMWPVPWIIDRAVVDTQFGNDVLNLYYDSKYRLRDGGEFFFQNHPGALDKNGEWCYNGASKNLQIYNDQGASATQQIMATVYSRGVDIANIAYVSLRNLHITETLNTSLYAQNVSNLTLTNLDITDAGEDGIIVAGSGSNIVLENSKMYTVNNNGVYIDPSYQNVIMRGNSLRAVGSVAGRGKSGDGMYNCVQSESSQNILIENNVIDSVGYNGITFKSNTTIRQNVISNYCISKVDGGGVYAWNGNKAPMGNIHIVSNILYASPNVRGKYSYQDYSIGIFLDDCVENVEIRNNTVFGNTQWGVFLHGANGITFTDNTLFDNHASQLVVYHNGGICPVRNDIIKRNISVSKLPTQLVAQYESNADDLFQYGQIDSNYYARPFKEEGSIFGIKNGGQGGFWMLSDWRNFSGGLDLNTKKSPITYNQYKNEGSGGTSRINSTFDTDANGWYVVYSNYNNAEANQDATNKLDGGSLRVGFTTPSGQSNSYAQTINRFGTITKGKTYVLRFDAVASADVTILAYLRSYGPPYVEYDRRYNVAIGTTRKSYEFVFTANETGTDAVVMFQIDGEGPTFWLDNIRLQEGVPIQNNPDDFIKLFYNPTLKDSVITLTDVYRDVKNQTYSGSLTLKPFTSVILLRDTLPVQPADLSLSLQSRKRVLQVNEPTTIELRVINQGLTTAALSRWTYRLPANLQFAGGGQNSDDNVLTGTVQQLPPLSDTTFVFSVRPTTPGIFRAAAQITTATSPDPDSRPNSGTADGEDDAATTELRVGESASTVFESPNPNQRSLLAVQSNQPTPDPNKADLSLRMEVSNRAPAKDEIVRITLYVSNAGGLAVSGVQLQNQLPDGFVPVNLTDWTANGRIVSTTTGAVAAGATVSTSFQVRVTAPGTSQAQISGLNVPVADPDSTPGNGFTNGEDDEAQIDIRISR